MKNVGELHRFVYFKDFSSALLFFFGELPEVGCLLNVGEFFKNNFLQMLNYALYVHYAIDGSDK